MISVFRVEREINKRSCLFLSPMNSKRHSMPIGPRPLQLAGNGASVPDAPLSAAPSAFGYALSPSPRSPAPSTPTTPNGGPRRQSSITYNPASAPARPARGHRTGALGRSNSVGGVLDRNPRERDRSNANGGPPERSPVTLAEKHADLLHFIAQKESKCLELRSQLAMHEAELLQLKRKWERIVSRGFTLPHNPAPPSSASASSYSSYSFAASPTTPFSASSSFAPSHSNSNSASNSNSNPASGSSANASPNPNGGAVLDGIREGVQGVGRFIAAHAFSPGVASASAYASAYDGGKGGGKGGGSASPYAAAFEGVVG
ncbi:hypothetical protein B0H16DRAFT_1881591, partial [Mycena metata]